jgi:hypothetical protein
MKMSVIGIPSIRICPDETSVMRIRALIMVDLPEPVLPTMPTFSPALMVTLKFSMMFGRSSRYLMEAFLNYIYPCLMTGFSSSSLSDQSLQ